MNTGVYEIRNNLNGHRYIGSAVSFSRRWGSHISDLRRGVHHSVHLQRAWIRDGAQNFEFLPLVFCSKEHLLLYEQLALDALRPEYNICTVAGNILGLRRSEETKAKLRLARTRYVVSDETRKKLSIAQSARVYPRDVVERIRAINTEQKRSPEARARMAAAQLGNCNARGRRSDEARARMSLAKRERGS